jgi:hypothetical protein
MTRPRSKRAVDALDPLDIYQTFLFIMASVSPKAREAFTADDASMSAILNLVIRGSLVFRERVPPALRARLAANPLALEDLFRLGVNPPTVEEQPRRQGVNPPTPEDPRRQGVNPLTVEDLRRQAVNPAILEELFRLGVNPLTLEDPLRLGSILKPQLDAIWRESASDLARRLNERGFALPSLLRSLAAASPTTDLLQTQNAALRRAGICPLWPFCE